MIILQNLFSIRFSNEIFKISNIRKYRFSETDPIRIISDKISTVLLNSTKYHCIVVGKFLLYYFIAEDLPTNV